MKELLKTKKELALLMLFKTAWPTNKSARYCTYAQVARVLGMTSGQVYHLCRHAQRMSSKKPR